MEAARDDEWKRFTTIISDILGTDASEILPTATAKDIDGWDSIAHLIIITQIEREFNVQIPANKLDKVATVGQLYSLIRESPFG
jgi:acyl carrier protein